MRGSLSESKLLTEDNLPALTTRQEHSDTVPAGLRQTVIASRAKDFGSVQVNDEPPAGFDVRPHNCHCRLFRGHVSWCSHHRAGYCSRRARVSAREPRDTEAEQLGVRASALPNGHVVSADSIARSPFTPPEPPS